MSVRYYIRFLDIDGRALRLDIGDANYQGNPVEVKGGVPPFVTRVDYDDDPLQPLRFSKGTLSIVNRGEVDSDFMPEDVLQCPVTLSEENGGRILWKGYIVPSTYDQPIVGSFAAPSVVSFEVISEAGAVAGLRAAAQTVGMTNLASLLSGDMYRWMDEQPVTCYPAEWRSSSNAAASHAPFGLSFSMAAFADEEEYEDEEGEVQRGYKARTFGEILEGFCRLFGWVLYDQPGFLIFVSPGCDAYEGLDPGTLSRVATGIYEGDADYYFTSRRRDEPVPGGTDNTVSRVPGNYRVEVTARLEDVSGPVYAPSADNFGLYEFYRRTYTPSDYDPNDPLHDKRSYLALRVLELDSRDGRMKCHMYNPGQATAPGSWIWEESAGPEGFEERDAGAFYCQQDYWQAADGEEPRASYNFRDALCMMSYSVTATLAEGIYAFIPEGTLLCQISSPVGMAYSGGAFIVSGEVAVGNAMDHGPNQWYTLRLQVHVGAYYWDGERWTNNSNAYFEPELYDTGASKKIKNQSALDDPYVDADGYIIPTDGLPVSGFAGINVLAGRYGGSDEKGVDPREHYLLGLSLDFEPRDWRLFSSPLERESLHYVAYTGCRGAEEKEQEVILHTMRDSIEDYGQLRKGAAYASGDPIEKLSHLENGGWTDRRPETALLQRMKNVYGRPQTRLKLQVKWPEFEAWDWFAFDAFAGRLLPVGWTHDWRDGLGELTLFNYRED